MSDLAALNKSVSLSSASHDFVLLAKSLAAARVASPRRALAQTVPSMRVREVLSDLKSALTPMSLSDSSAMAPYSVMADGFFASLAAFQCFSKIYNVERLQPCAIADADCCVDDRTRCRSGERTCGKVVSAARALPAQTSIRKRSLSFS